LPKLLLTAIFGLRDLCDLVETAFTHRLHLDKDLPNAVGRAEPAFVETLIDQAKALGHNVPPLKDMDIACHTGGPRVLYEVAKASGVDDAALASSWAVMRAHGNLSGASNLAVLDHHNHHNRGCTAEEEDGKWVVCISMGPGVCIEGALLRRISSVDVDGHGYCQRNMVSDLPLVVSSVVAAIQPQSDLPRLLGSERLLAREQLESSGKKAPLAQVPINSNSGDASVVWTGWHTKGYTCLPLVSDESKRRGEVAQLRPTDVVVITFPKTGTTLLQQVCEQLRTGGDMSFTEIEERQPWLEFAWDCGQDLDDDQVAFPRLFKSHQLLSAINPGAKYLSILRDPETVLTSWFHFQKAKKRPFTVDCADANEYALTGHFEGSNIFGTSVWDYYVELWEARHEANVLVLCYETLVKNKRAYLPHIARFLGTPDDDFRLETVLQMSSKEFMAEHEHQFDEHFIRDKGMELGRAAQIMEAVPKVTTRQKDALAPKTLEWLERNWAEKVTPRTGLASYKDMCVVFHDRCT
jgi:hypothetical protein